MADYSSLLVLLNSFDLQLTAYYHEATEETVQSAVFELLNKAEQTQSKIRRFQRDHIKQGKTIVNRISNNNSTNRQSLKQQFHTRTNNGINNNNQTKLLAKSH